MAYFVKPSGEKRQTLDGARAIALYNSKRNVAVEYTVWKETEPIFGWRNGRERLLPYSRFNSSFNQELNSIQENMRKVHRVGNARVNTTLYCPTGRYVMRVKTK